MTRGPILLGGAALVVVASIWWFAAPGDDLRADWVEVERDDLVLGVDVTGTLRAVDSSFLGPPQVPDTWEFKISMLAAEGDNVSRGDPVLGFDTSEFERKLQEKSAEADAAAKKIEQKKKEADLRRRQDDLRLAEAEARLRRAELKVEVPPDLAASRDLYKERLELEQARTEIEHLEAKMEADRQADTIAIAALERQREGAERRVQEIRDAIDRMTIPAPRDGTVVYVSNWRGEKKKVGDSAWRQDQILEIPDLTRMYAEGEVDEADSGRIAAGQRVRFTLDAHPDLTFEGRIRSIWSTVQRKSWRDPVKVVRLRIDLDETDPTRMRPGMRFRGSIETGRIEKAVLVPSDAVFP